jgi:hypothetical protein
MALWCEGRGVSIIFIRQSEEEAGFEMAVLQKKKCVFFPVKGSKGSEGSKCLYSGRVFGS